MGPCQREFTLHKIDFLPFYSVQKFGLKLVLRDFFSHGIFSQFYKTNFGKYSGCAGKMSLQICVVKLGESDKV